MAGVVIISRENEISILGSGTMGHSIALSAAWAGMTVKVWGVSALDIAKAKNSLSQKLDVLRSYDVINLDEEYEIVSRISFTESKREALLNASFIIEAIPEVLSLKQDFFKELDEECPIDVVLASSTSGLSPTQISIKTKFPQRTLVTHFWNPAHLVPLVEVVRGEKTSDETVAYSLDLLKSMNKRPIVLNKDIQGSIGNRLQYALFREAQYIYQQGVASIEDIDAAVRYSIGRRLAVTGPFMTADMGGLDVFDLISTYLFQDLSVQKESSELMKDLVGHGFLGQKTGKGFYDWDPEFSEAMNRARERELIEWLKRDRSIMGQEGSS